MTNYEREFQDAANGRLPSPAAPVRQVPLDVKEALADAKTEVVALNDIDLDDDSYKFRMECEPCPADSFVDDDGVVDASSGHAVVLVRYQNTGRYRILNGRRRLAGMKNNPTVERVRCRTLSGITRELATIIAAEANLDNAQPLTNAEKRRCFLEEYAALKAGGFQTPSMREFAKRFRVAPGTPANWLDSQGQAAKGVCDDIAAGSLDGVQIGHAESSDAGQPLSNDGIEVEDGKKNGAAGAALALKSTFSPLEAFECLKESVEMIEALTDADLADRIDEFRDLHKRLGETLSRGASNLEAAA